MRKEINVFQVQNINTKFKELNIQYKLKLVDACGSQSLTLLPLSEDQEKSASELVAIANEVLAFEFIKLESTSINPYNLKVV